MIGPVSGTGRAMMASLQQAIQKGMPPDQAIQYVKSMATQGVAPLTDLYAMMNQFQRLKQQPVQAPQTPPTIRDQLNMAEQQQAQQQMAMQQGLGGLPAPAMEQAQFAGGGIVAFDEGGEVNPISYMQRLIREALARGDTETADEIRASLEDYTSLGRNVRAALPSLPTRSNLGVDLREARFRQQQGMAPVAAAPSPTAPARPRLGREATGSAVMFPGDNTPQTNRPAPPAPPRTDTTSRGGIGSRVPAAPTAAAPAQLTREEMENQEYERIQAFRKREGLGSASEKLQQFLTDEGSKLDKQFGEDRMLAFAEAGFKMAAAASRPGATFLGAFSEGAISGTQALRGLQKEMNANRRGLKESMLKLEEAKELRKEGDFKTAMQQTQQARAEMLQREELDKRFAMDELKLQAVIEGNRLQYAAATARGDGRSSSGAIAAIKMQVEGLDLDYKDQQEIANDMTRTAAERQQARALMGQIRKQRDQLVSGATLSGTGESRNPLSGFSATEED